MNKAASWNVNGVGFDAREAAREAARRQGKSLGEWLHGVIADHANEIGVETDEMGGRQRIEAVTSKLERLSTRSADHDRRLRAGRTDDLATRRRERERAGDDVERDGRDHEFRPPGRRGIIGLDTSDPILEEAIEAMERRAVRAERRADEAMRSVDELLRRNETCRDRERDSVAEFAQKLSDIESRLAKGFAQVDDNPIKGALARLEARLDRIGRRGAAEAVRPQTSTSEAPAAPEPHLRLEEKLNTILDAVHGRQPAPIAEASPIAIGVARAASGKDRRLGEAIAEIAKRQQALEGSNVRPAPLTERLRWRENARETRRFEGPSVVSAPFAAMQSEISALASKIEGLHRGLSEQPRKAQPPVDLGGLRSEITTMSDMLRDLAPQGRVAQLEDSVRGLTQRLETSFDLGRREVMPRPGVSLDEVDTRRTRVEPSDVDRIQDQMREIRDLVEATAARPLAVDRIEQQIAALNDRFDRSAHPFEPATDIFGRQQLAATFEPAPMAPQTEPSTLETLVRDLSHKMEAVRAPDANHQALDALQDQIAALASRFERSDNGLAKLASLEKSMRELFVHLDETRASVETSASRAAREVLRIAMEDGRAQTEQGTVSGFATMQVLQDEAEARTQSTLSAVHDTLEKVVDRLAVMETEIADVRARKPAAAPTELPSQGPLLKSAGSAEPRAKAISLGAADPFLDQVLGQRGPETSRKKKDNTSSAERNIRPDLDAEDSRSDFIAAARRAAKAAQTDASLADFKLSADAKARNPARENLIAQSRDYVARHKRPVLLSIAALFVIVGTMAVMHRIGLGSNDVQIADATPSALSRTIESVRQVAPSRSVELTPSALPKSAPPLSNPIPGSDPIQTGSIPSLPAFAAQGAAQTAPRPTLPSRLKAMANGGDGDAEYVLATQYAEGRVVPRDFKLAASWYQKAADQGIAPAQYRLASLYEKGLGVAQDKTKAKTLYVQAAEAGNPRAMHNLAVLLADGDGKPDYEGATTWFRKAAQYGIHDSQYNLAILLARGLGTQQSLVQSYQWFAIAAAQNDSDAAKKRDEVGTKLNANDLAVAKALAASFRARIADIAATDVQPPPGGWDGASAPSPVNSARAKISSL